MLRQPRAGIEQQLDLAEEMLAQLLVGLKKWQQHLVPLGHIEIHGRRNLLEIGHGFFNLPRQRFAVVNVERAAVIQHAIKIVIAAESVVPRRPVEQHRRRIVKKRQRVRNLALVAGEHALGVDDAFGVAGGAGGKQEFGDGVWRHCRIRRIDGGSGYGTREVSVQTRGPANGRVGRDHDLGVRRYRRGDSGTKRLAISGEHQTGIQQRDDMTQLFKVFRHQRIGHRDRRVGNAHVHGSEAEQRVLEIVAGENDQRALRRELAVEQRLRECAHLVQRHAVTQLHPLIVNATFGKKRLIAPFARPFDQPVGDAAIHLADGVRRAQDERAIGTAFERGVACAEAHGTIRRCSKIHLNPISCFIPHRPSSPCLQETHAPWPWPRARPG